MIVCRWPLKRLASIKTSLGNDLNMQAQKSFILNLKVVTPMFLGGPEKQAELRPQSIKGALRFWFRATHQNYREKEGQLFGSEEHGTGYFSVSLKDKNLLPNGNVSFNSAADPLRYVAYGMEKREAVREGSTFSLELRFRYGVAAEDRESIKRTVWAWLVFGGLGARSRRGFGALCVLPPYDEQLSSSGLGFRSKADLTNSVTKFINSVNKPSDLPYYSCFSFQSRCLIGPEEVDAKSVLRSIAQKLRDYRSFEKRKSLTDVHERDLFLSDHDNVKHYLKDGTLPPLPDRIAFGLPHNYYFKSLVGWAKKNKFDSKTLEKLVSEKIVKQTKDGTNFVRFAEAYHALRNQNDLHARLGAIGLSADKECVVIDLWRFSIKSFPTAYINLFSNADEERRRASPLFIHIQELENGKACPVVTLLKAKLLPEDGKVMISRKGNTGPPIRGDPDFKPIDEFLDDLKSNGNYEEISIQKA